MAYHEPTALASDWRDRAVKIRIRAVDGRDSPEEAGHCSALIYELADEIAQAFTQDVQADVVADLVMACKAMLQETESRGYKSGDTIFLARAQAIAAIAKAKGWPK